MDQVTNLLQAYFSRYGYWTLAVALLLENAGLPVPGETVLLFASFLAYSQHQLALPAIIVVGTVAAMSGDNLGYGIGRWGGRPLLRRYRRTFHIHPETIDRGERLFARYGSAAVFFARFIFGMRVIAGPLAGVLRMHWKRFVTFNALGAVTWVVTVSLLGYTFGKHWDQLLVLLDRAGLALAVGIVALALGLWWRRRRLRAKG
ncbi:MAG: DedA family protein [Bacteroidales bacterium]